MVFFYNRYAYPPQKMNIVSMVVHEQFRELDYLAVAIPTEIKATGEHYIQLSEQVAAAFEYLELFPESHSGAAKNIIFRNQYDISEWLILLLREADDKQ